MPEMFASGVVGFVDDRLADANGWGTFDVSTSAVQSPCFTAPRWYGAGRECASHGRDCPGATLRIFEDLGHLSVVTKAVEVTSELLMSGAFAR